MPIEQTSSASGNTLRLFGSLTVLSIGVAGTLATVLGFFGSLWWAFDLLSGYRLQLAAILLVVAAGFRIGFGIATGALFLAAAFTNAIIVAPLFVGSATSADTDTGILHVATLPVEETGKDEAMNWIVESEVDLAFLLDTDDTWEGVEPPPGTGYVTVDQIFVGRQSGITVVARAGLDVTIEDKRGSASHPVIRVATRIGDQNLAMYVLHLPAPGSNSEANVRNDLLSYIAREASAETIPVAVIGGLGAAPWPHAFGILNGESNLVDSSPGNGFQASSPGNFWIGFRVPYHHLLHSPTLTASERHIDTDLGAGMRILQATLAQSAP